MIYLPPEHFGTRSLRSASKPAYGSRTSRFYYLCAFAFLCTLETWGGHALGADTWVGNSGTNWNTAANWSTGLPAGVVIEFQGAGTSGTGLFNNITGLSLTGIQFDASAPSYFISGNAFSLSGVITNNSANTQTISDNITDSLGSNVIFDQGPGSLVLSGSLIQTASGVGGVGWVFNASLTTLSGGFTTTTTSGRVLIWSGTGNILLSSIFGLSAASSGAIGLTYTGSGTLTFSNAAGGSISGANAPSNNISIASGAAAISGSTGNSTLQISGNYTIGSAGAATLTIKGGNGTSTTQGTLSLLDSNINTLFINSTTAGATVLTMGQSGTAPTILNMEIGKNSADSILLGSGLKASVAGTGGVLINLNGIGGFTTAGSYTLLDAPGTSLNLANFSLNSLTGNLGGFTSFGLVVTSGSMLQVTVGGANPTPANAYWGGALGSSGSGSWITFTGGTNNNSNWLTSQSGGTDPHQSPGATTNVFFIADTGSNVNTNIGVNTTIESLNFTGTDAAVITGSSVTISGTVAGSGTNLILTINAFGVSGNTAGNGITTGAGAGTDTISANLTLGGNQTWTLNASPSAPLIVSGTLSGAHSLTVGGTGELILQGNNTFTNGLTISGSAIVVLSSTGALNAASPNAVSFSAGSAGTLNINGQNVTIGTLSTNASPGSPVIQNANVSTTGTLTVAQSGSSTYAGVLRDGAGSAALALSLASGTLTLSGINSYTGPTNVNGGDLNILGSLGAGSLVNVNGGVLSGPGGAINGTVTVKNGGELMPGTAASPGTLTLGNGLTINSGGITAFNIGTGSNDFINLTGGSLLYNSGAIIEVTGGLSASGTFTLLTATSAPSLAGVVFNDLNGNSLATNDPHYSITVSGNSIILSISPASTAIPNITLTSPANGTRVMANMSGVSISGSVGNTGVLALNGTLSGTGGALTIGNFNPTGGTFQTGTGAVTIFTGTIVNTGSALGLNSYKVTVTDGAAEPSSVSTSGTLDVLGNRIVAATGGLFGSIHEGAIGSASTTLSSTGADNQFTRVTVADGGVDSGSFGISVTGGNPGGTFNGSFTDGRSLTGSFGALGAQSGTVTLTTGGEGLTGESPVNVSVGYTAQVFSGQASWASSTGGSWVANNNWGDTQAGDLNGFGAPGLAGAASIGDTAAFNNVAGQSGVTTVNLSGTTVTLAGITFNSSNGYTISSGTIILQGASTPVVVTTGTGTITSVLAGSGAGMNKSGAGMLVIGAAGTYTGSTTIGNGTIRTTVTNALPTATFLTLGDGGSNSGVLVLAANQGIAGLATAGTGTGNSIVGGTTTNSILTLNTGPASAVNTFSGNLGGSGANQNNLGLTITGSGMEILTGSVTYIGATTISGGVLQTPNLLPASSPITLNGGVWQPVLSGSTNYNFTLGTTAAGNVNSWTAGGFAAFGGTLVITANGGAQLTWGSGGFAAVGGGPITFGSPTSNGQVIFTNSINLGATDSFAQTIIVNGTTPGSSVLLTGQITQPPFNAGNPAQADGIKKTGLGMLILSNTTNNFSGVVTVEQGSLVAAGNSVGTGGGVFGSGTGSPNGTSTTPAAAFNINLGDGATIASSNPSLYILGAFQVDRNITANNNSTNNNYAIGGLSNASGTFSGIITVQSLSANNNFFNISQVATTGSNALNITGGIASNGGAGESVNFINVGAVNVTAPISGAGFSVVQNGPGVTSLANNNTYTGVTTIRQGVLNVINTNGSATGTNSVSVSPNANTSAALSGSGFITGAVTTVFGGGLSIPHIAPGVNGGNLLGGVGTLSLKGGLTIGNSTDLDFDLGSLSDLIAVTGQLTLGAGVIVNINPVAGFTTGTYNLITYTGALTGNTSGWTVVGAAPATVATFSSGSGVVTLTLTPNTPAANAYWSGAYGAGGSGTWNTFANGSSFNTNWLTAISSGTDPDQVPFPTTNVFFIADTGSNTNTFLGANFTINSLNFTGTDAAVTTGSAVTISGSITGSGSNSTLTINATGANGNTPGSGITTAAGSGADTINAPLILGGNQTWTLNAAPGSPLTVNGSISGAHSLAVSGSGQLVLGGNNTFNGGFTINNNVNVVLNNPGALNSAAPNSLTFGAASTGTLNLNGNSITIGTLSSNGGLPVIRNGNAANVTLTINQSGSGIFGGSIRDGAGGGTLALTKSGPGVLTLTGSNSYTGSTIVNSGILQVNGSLGSSSNVSVNSGGVLGGAGGTIAGGVTVNAGGTITSTVGTGGAPGILTLTSPGGLTISGGGIAAFNIVNAGANDEIIITGAGGLTLSPGAILQVTPFLTTSGTYALMTYLGPDPSLDSITKQSLTGGALSGNYSFVASGGTLELVVAPSPLAVAGITITSPVSGSRVIMNTGVAVSGSVLNTGTSNSLTGTLADAGLTIATSNFNPTVATVGPGGAVSYTGTIASVGANLGNQTYGVSVTDGDSINTTATASGTLDVVANRVVTATGGPSLGVVHVGTVVSGTVTLSSTGADNQFTRVTVGNATDAFGISVSGGNPSGTFNGSFSDQRVISGTFTTTGNETGITLNTTGEGLSGESPQNVVVGISAQVFSGHASWALPGNGSWAANSNWGDTLAPNLGGIGAPGLSGALSAGDVALLTDVAGQSGTTTISLNGVSPSLAALTFSSTATVYNIATGTGFGVLNMQSGGSFNVTTGTGQISAVIAGSTPVNFNVAPGSDLIVSATSITHSGSMNFNSGTTTFTLPGLLGGANTDVYTIAAGATLELNTGTAQNLVSTANTITFTGNGTLLKSGTAPLQNHSQGGTIFMNMTGGTIEIAAGLFQSGGGGGNGGVGNPGNGGGSINWTNNKASLLIDAAGSIDPWNGANITVDALLGSGTVTRLGFGNGNNVINIGINNGSGTFAGTITNALGNISINKVGTGLEVLTGSNSYGGYTAIGGGTLRVTNSFGLGFGGISFITFQGQHTATSSGTSALDIAGGITINETLTLNNGSLVNSVAGTTSIFDSGIVGVNFGTDSGTISGTVSPITVTFTGGSGTGASASAGTVNGNGSGGSAANLFTQMTNAGSGYLPGSAPTVVITQGSGTLGGTTTALVSQLILVGNNNFIGGAGNLQINAQINGAGGFTTIGSGTVILTNIELFTGASSISAGSTLQFGNGTAGFDGNIASNATLQDNGQLIFDRVGSFAFNGSITGTGSVLVEGSGTQTFGGVNTYTGATTIAGGATLQLGNGTTDGSIVSSTLTNNGALIFATTTSQNLPAVITGTGNITMIGSGNQELSGNNNYTGATIISSGTLQLGSTTALGNTSGITVSGSGALNLSNGLTPQTITLSNNGETLSLNNGSVLGFGVANAAADKLIITNGAVLTLNGTTFIDLSLLSGTGGSFTIITDLAGFQGSGSFALGPLPALATGTLTQTGTTVSISFNGISTVFWKGNGATAGSGFGLWSDFTNFTSNAAGTTQITGTFGPTQDVVFSASGAINQTSGTNFLDTSISAHSLTINDPAGVDIGFQNTSDILNLAGTTGITGINVGSVAGSALAEIDAYVNLGGKPNITVNNSGGLLITGVISGTAGLIVNGSGMLTLTGPLGEAAANTYTGGTQLLSGTLSVDGDAAFGSSGSANGVMFNPGAGNSVTLRIDYGAPGFATTLTTAADRPFALVSGTSVLDPGPAGNVMTILGNVSGAGALTIVNTGEVILGGTSLNYNGAANVISGTLALSFAGTLGQSGSSSFNTAPGATLIVSTQAAQNISPSAGNSVAFTGSGTLIGGAGGLLTLHGHTGAQGTVYPGNGEIYIDMSGGVIEVAPGGVVVNGGPGATVASPGNSTNGTGSPAWTGTYNGTPFTNLASLQIDASGTFDVWNGNNVLVDALNGSGVLTRRGFANNEPASIVTLGDNNGSGTFSGVITNQFGVLNIIKTGTGVQVFAGDNSYTGSTLVGSGVLRVTSSTGLGNGGRVFYTGTNIGNAANSTVTVTGSAKLDLFGAVTIDKVIVLNGGRLINASAGSTAILDNGIAAVTIGGTQVGTFVQPTLTATSPGTGNGASFAAGSGSAPGGTNLFAQVVTPGSGYTTAPVLAYTDSSGSGSGVTATAVLSSLTLQGNSSLNFLGGNGNLTINAVISGTSGFITTGTGVLALTGSNTYTGPTTVAIGTLMNNGYINSIVSVTPNASAPATISGTGVFLGAVSIAPASGSNVAHIAPGVNSSGNFGVAGTLKFNNGLTIGNGTNLDFDLDGTSDLIAVTGALSLGTGVTLNVNPLFGFGPGTYTLMTYTGALTGDTTGWTLAGLPGDSATFASGGGTVTVTISVVTNDSQLAITPSPVSLGSVLVGFTPSSGTATLTNQSANGSSANFTTASSGSVSVVPLSGSLIANASTTLTPSATAPINLPSGNGQVIGTISAANSTRPSGSAAPVNVTVDVFEAFSGSTSVQNLGDTTVLNLTNFANDDGPNGQRAGVTITGYNVVGNTNFVGVIDNGGSVDTATQSTGNVTQDVGTVTTALNLLNGTYNYNGTVTGTARYTDPNLAAQAAVPNQVWTGVSLTATVTGNTSDSRGNTFSAQIMSGSGYAGYSLSSSVQVSGNQSHPNTGSGGSQTTTASLLGGTASATTTVKMSFDSTPETGPDTSSRVSDILTLTGIASVGTTTIGALTVTLTDKFVLQLTYDSSASGVELIGQNTGTGWVNAVTLNSSQTGNTLYANTDYFTYLAGTPGGNTPGLGAYGYLDGAAWAVLDHTSVSDPLSEFAVIPEPGTYAMIFSGFGMLAGFRKLRRRSRGRNKGN